MDVRRLSFVTPIAHQHITVVYGWVESKNIMGLVVYEKSTEKLTVANVTIEMTENLFAFVKILVDFGRRKCV